MLSHELIEGFQRLAAGDFSYRLPQTSADDEAANLVLAFNKVADELESIIGKMQANEQRLNVAVDNISAALMQVGEGNLDVHIERDYKGDQIDVLAFLVDTTIGELRVRVAEDRRRSEQIQSQLEAQVEERTRELREARDSAQAATRAKSVFLATMSHEIRTPLNAVIGMTGLLMDTPLNATQHEFASTIRSSGDALLAIINDILDFSKIEAERIELEHRPFDLRKCVESSITMLSDELVAKGLELSYLISADVAPAIFGDEARLRQILLNLLTNAIKFTEAGEISISIRTTGSGEQPAPGLHFAIRDTGIGIPADRMERLFHAFSQVDSSTTRNYGGTGLGLAISRRLSELMGGRMWAESAGVRGKGSTFYFTIQAPPARAERQAFLDTEPLDLRGRRALLVDDNATNLRILSLQVQGWGMKYAATKNPIEALEWIRQGEPFEIALIDRHMPEMDGMQLADGIRRVRDAKALPLVLISSTRTKGDDDGLFSASLLKPVHPSRLYDTLVGILAGRGVPISSTTPAPSAFDPQMARRLPLRILVAEDHPTNQRLALLMLERLGYRADVAANGREVLEAVERQEYDVILMDVQMPEMDGLEATRLLRERHPVDQGPRIVAMTANVTKRDRSACLAAGMNDYLPKPIRVEELVAALNRAQPAASDADSPPGTNSSQPAEPVATKGAVMAPSRLDQDAVANLLNLVGGDDGNLKALINSFREETPLLLERVRQAVDANDAELLRRSGHTLKSSSRDFGAIELSELGRQLEEMGKQGRFEGAAELALRAETEFLGVQQALQKLSAGGSNE